MPGPGVGLGWGRSPIFIPAFEVSTAPEMSWRLWTLSCLRYRMAIFKKLSADPHESAQAVGLRYVSPDALGITRRGERFFRPEGRELQDPSDLARIKSLVIPPAWKRVWICPLAKGHLQAIGYDQRGRR